MDGTLVQIYIIIVVLQHNFHILYHNVSLTQLIFIKSTTKSNILKLRSLLLDSATTLTSDLTTPNSHFPSNIYIEEKIETLFTLAIIFQKAAHSLSNPFGSSHSHHQLPPNNIIPYQRVPPLILDIRG